MSETRDKNFPRGSKDFAFRVVYLYEHTYYPMNHLRYFIVLLIALSLVPAYCDDAKSSADIIQKEELQKFDLDFPGGTPGELVAAIGKALGRPLNAIVPDDYAALRMPALRMHNVDTKTLFHALEQTRTSIFAHTEDGRSFYSICVLGFKAVPPITNTSIWSFFYDGPPDHAVQKTAFFYQLAPYLAQGLTVDDITTAIQTSWHMLGVTNMPTLSYHKETKLLIAVGPERELRCINGILRELNPGLKETSSQTSTIPGEQKSSGKTEAQK